MGFYGSWLLPRVLDLVMQQKQIKEATLNRAAFILASGFPLLLGR